MRLALKERKLQGNTPSLTTSYRETSARVIPLSWSISPASQGADHKPEQKTKRKRVNPTQSLLRAKKKLDEAIQRLDSYPDLSQEASELRGKVFQRFIEEEENSVPR